MIKPMRIFIGGEELETYTSARLERSKKQMTGSLTVEIFLDYIPSKPVIVNAVRGKEILVYVMGELAFTGIVDKRKGRAVDMQPRDSNGRFAYAGGEGSMTGASGGDVSVNFSQGQGYTVTLTARGRTKYLIDSSHNHPTGTFKKTSDKKVIEALVKEHNVELQWDGQEIDEPKVTLRDGNRIYNEIFERCNQNCHFAYETRDGQLLITDGASGIVGEDLILGQNILNFSAEQSEDQANSQITVKGHRTARDVWGKDAIVQPVQSVADSWVGANIPLTIQHYGDATNESLQRRAKFEADRRAAESKKVSVTVFHVAQQSGTPWDIGNLHYVEIPPEGIFDTLECVSLVYSVDAKSTLETVLELAPPPSQGISGGAAGVGSGLLSSVNNLLADLTTKGVARRIQAGVSIIGGQYPSSWTSAALSAITNPISAITSVVNSLLANEEQQPPKKPPMRLPPE
jgi:prophage tail gpP-like protein